MSIPDKPGMEKLIEMKKEKLLAYSEVLSTHYVEASFSFENKMLAAQGGAPDWTLVLFNVEKGKVFSILRLSDTHTFENVASVKFHPRDHGVISLVGEGVLLLLKLHDKLLKPWGYPGGSGQSCTCQGWIDTHILVVGTKNNSLLLIEDGDLRSELTISHPDFVKWGKLEKSQNNEGTSMDLLVEQDLPRHTRVTAIKGFGTGFICACGPDKIFVFYKSDNIHEYYTQGLVLRLSEQSPAARVCGRGDHTITSLSISANRRSIICTTDSGQIFINEMPTPDMTQLQVKMFKHLHHPLHRGKILDMDFCVWKPLVASVGHDKTLRVWDSEKHDLVFMHSFKDDIYSVALHPTGLHVSIGLTDGIHVFHMLFDSIREFCQFKIRRCSLCKFSRGGQTLAVVDSNLLTLFSTVFQNRITTLKGHTNKITGIEWSNDDLSLISCSNDGGIFGWDLKTSSVAWELRTDECTFLTTDLQAPTNGSNPTIFSGNTNKIYHFTIGQMIEEGSFSMEPATCLTFSSKNKMLILGTKLGNLFLFKIDSIFTATPTKIKAHASAVNKILLTQDENFILTCADDGILIEWNLKMEDSELLETSATFPKVPETFVSKNDVDKMSETIKSLKIDVTDLKRDKTHHLKLQSKEYEKNFKQINFDFKNKIGLLEEKVSALENELHREKQCKEKEIKETTDKFLSSETKIRENYQQKLLFEYKRHEKLEEKIAQLKKEHETKMTHQIEKDEQVLSEKNQNYDLELEKIKENFNKFKEEISLERKETSLANENFFSNLKNENLKNEMELKEKFDNETKISTNLREEREILNRKLNECSSESSKYKSEMNELEIVRQNLKEKVVECEKVITALKKDLEHRDYIIELKEKELSTRRRELEAEKLSKNALENLNTKLRTQISDNIENLDSNNEQIVQLKEKVSELRLKYEACDAKLMLHTKALMASRRSNKNLLHRCNVAKNHATRFQHQLVTCGQLIHDHKSLQENLKVIFDTKLNKKTSQAAWIDDLRKDEMEDFTIQKTSIAVPQLIGDGPSTIELLRQKNLLEKTIAQNKSASKKKMASLRAKMLSLSKENAHLLSIVHDLNDKLKYSECKIKLRRAKKKINLQKTSNTENQRKIDLTVPADD